MLTDTPDLSYSAQLSARVNAAQGRQQAALATLAGVDRNALDAHHTFHLAESVAMAGDTARALELLEWAVDHGMYPYRSYAEFCPLMEPVRGMPEFDRIVVKAARRGAEFSA